MEVKFKRKITDYGYILTFDLAKSKSGWALLQIEPFQILEKGMITTKKEEAMPWDDYYHQILDIFNFVKQKYGDNFFIIKECCPQQAGKKSSISALQELGKAHAIFDLATVHADVDYYDWTGVYAVSVKAVFKHKLQMLESPDKYEINGYIRAAYPEIELGPFELDISDAIGVGITLIERKWNVDLDGEIKAQRKAYKELRSERARKLLMDKIEFLETLRYKGEEG